MQTHSWTAAPWRPRRRVLCRVLLTSSPASLQPCLAAALLGPMGGSTPHGQHNKSHKTGKHQAKGQRHKQREAKGELRRRSVPCTTSAGLPALTCVSWGQAPDPLLPCCTACSHFAGGCEAWGRQSCSRRGQQAPGPPAGGEAAAGRQAGGGGPGQAEQLRDAQGACHTGEGAQ